MDFWTIIYILDLVLFVGVAMTVLYMVVFSFASLFNKHQNVPKAKRQNRFIILIPAYRQDKVILNTVKSILSQSYPQRMFDVTVISDHQSEMTNMHLAQFPITILTPNFAKSSKAKSLQYAILNLPEFKIYDAVIILDADNLVEQEFVEQMNDAYESAGTKAILGHRIPKNRDTPSARLDAIFEEINTAVFRRGHTNIGLSAALTGSGVAYEFNWFKKNIMKARTSGEDKELEAMLVRQHIYIDYFDHILIYDEKTRQTEEFNKQRGRWITTQLRVLLANIRFLPTALINREYDWIDKIVQWMLIPRTIMFAMIAVMCIVMPFIYFSLAIKWWIAGLIWGYALAIATPDYLVDKNWDKDFFSLPISTIKGFVGIIWKRFSN